MSSPSLFAQVAIPLAVLQHAYDYAVREEFRGTIQVGMRVLVPFGSKWLTGYVVGLTDSASVEKVKEIADLLDPEPLFEGELLSLTRWIAQYYLCSWGQALQCAGPPGINLEGNRTYSLTEDAENGTISRKGLSSLQEKILELLAKENKLRADRIASRVGRKNLTHSLLKLSRLGLLESEIDFGRRRSLVRKSRHVALVADCELKEAVEECVKARAFKQVRVLQVLGDLGDGFHPVGEVMERAAATGSVLKALSEKGRVVVEEREVAPSVTGAADSLEPDLKLEKEQQSAFDAVSRALQKEQFQTFLLKGVTGSGKTEIYLHAMRQVLNEGGGAIMLVPEISLTPLLLERLYARFGQRVAVLHSGLTLRERYSEWNRIRRRKEAALVVGARSALFAPVRNLRLIVVDEEHDSSYKQGETPRYNGRDTAVVRAKLANAVAILGSATPSMESLYNATTGKYTLLELKERIGPAKLPEIHLVNMRDEEQTLAEPVLSNHLKEKIRERLNLSEQVMIFLNRRGYAPFLLCAVCGNVPTCENCHVSLTFHTTPRILRCHYCGSTRKIPELCPECNRGKFSRMGMGTQKAEGLLRSHFPEARIERVDSDTTRGKMGAHRRVLKEFQDREVDILVGTQMIGKGHDFPGLTLVGVLSADTSLHFPDFRSAERTFQMLTQVAGRAGRRDRPGEVIIQTYFGDHYAISAAAHQDFDQFAKLEQSIRSKFGYPPPCHFLAFVFEGKDSEQVSLAAGKVTRGLLAARAEVRSPVRILGPATAPVGRVRNEWRWRAAALSSSPAALQSLGEWVRQSAQTDSDLRKVRIKIDMDPIDWL